MKSCFNAELFCENYQSVNKIMKDIGDEIKLSSKDLSTIFEKCRTEMTELFASLLAYTSRTVYLQESFCILSRECREGVARFQNQVKEVQLERDQLRNQLDSSAHDHCRVQEELKREMVRLNDEIERAQKAAAPPWWVLHPAVSDPSSAETSKEWYESQLNYYCDLASQREIKNKVLFDKYKELKESFESAEIECAKHLVQIKDLEMQAHQYDLQLRKRADTNCSGTQTAGEFSVTAMAVRPAVVSRGGSGHQGPLVLTMNRITDSDSDASKSLAASCASPRYTVSLPPNFHVVYDDENRQARLEMQRDSLRNRAGGRLSIISHRRASTARARPAAEAGDGASSWKHVMRRALCGQEDAVVMNLRKTSAAVGEIWAGLLSLIHSSGSHCLGMSTEVSSSTEVQTLAPLPMSCCK